MPVRFFGHASLRVTGADGRSVLMDPWFSREGAFFRSWFQFPENAHLEEEAFAGTDDVCVSHNHQDHFDPPVLRRALARNPRLRIHVAKFRTPLLVELFQRELPESAGRLVEHAAFEFFPAGGGRVAFVPEESPGQIDSAILWTDGETRILNLNDARLDTRTFERIKAALGTVDLFCLQGSGASEYPINYTWPKEEMRRRKREKRAAKLEACEKLVDLVDPKRCFFFAGPPVFLDPGLAHQNETGEESVFPDQLDIAKHFDRVRTDIAGRTLFALPGEDLDDRRLWPSTSLDDPRLAPFTKKAEYIESYRARRAGLVGFDPGEPGDDASLLAHFRGLVGLSSWASRKIGGAVDFVVKGRTASKRFAVDFANGIVRAGASAAPLYVLEAPASSVEAVVAGRATWDDVFLSIRMRFDERTPRFVAHLKTLLKYQDARLLDALEVYERELAQAEAAEELFVVECGGRRYEIQRRCPHAGVDLARQGRIESDGSITCLAHRFRFDLATGRCLNTDGFALRARPLDPRAGDTAPRTPADPT